LRFLIFSFISLFGLTHSSSARKSVHVQVRSDWGHTPLLWEASEFFWAQGDALDGLKYFEKLITEPIPTSDQAEYELALSAAGAFLGPTSLDVLRLALSMRMYSPKVEMWRQIRLNHFTHLITSIPNCNGAPLFLDQKHVLCSEVFLSSEPTAWPAAAQDAQLELFDFDVDVGKILGVAAQGVPTVLLYADLRDSALSQVHKALRALAVEKKVRYILRPLVPILQTNDPAEHQRLSVAGFGVELAVKNMEYKVIDDTKIQYSKSDEAESLPSLSDSEEEADSNGFYFSRLHQR